MNIRTTRPIVEIDLLRPTKNLLDIFQQFTFVIKQKEQHINLNISNNTNRYDRQKQNIIYKKKSANN